MQIKYDSLDQIEDSLKDSFVKWKDGDKEIYVHKQYADDMKEHFRLKGDHTELKTKFEDNQVKLDALSLAESERKKREDQDSLNDKKKNGKFDEIITDWENKYQTKEQELESMRKERLNDKKQITVERLASMGTDASRSKLARLIDQDLSFDDNGTLVVLNGEGKATSQTMKEYEGTLRDLYPELVKEVHSNGGKGNGGYNGGGGVSKTMKRTEFDKMDHGSRAKFFKDGGKLIE
jgi:hypothetical protein